MSNRRPATMLVAGLALGSLGLASAAAVGCRVVTEPLTWADGPNLDIVQNTDSDALCFAACQASSACNVSIRDPVSRSCFLKAAGPADLLQSLSLSSSYCAPAGCNVTTDKFKWADGDNLRSYAATPSDTACFAKCLVLPACKVSVRDPASGNCFLKAAGPDKLLRSLTLSSTYCAPDICKSTTSPLTWADGPNLDSFANTASDADCFAKCAANKDCGLSIRNPNGGSCFLKKGGPGNLLKSLELSTTYCTPEICPTTTATLRWADGPNLDAFGGTQTDAECFARCAANAECGLSIRAPNGGCFLKKGGPRDLLESLDLSTTFCTSAGPVPNCTPSSCASQQAANPNACTEFTCAETYGGLCIEVLRSDWEGRACTVAGKAGLCSRSTCVATADVSCSSVWTTLAQLPASLGEVTAGYDSRNGGQIVVVGEGDSRTFVYDIRTNAWSTSTTRPFVGNHHSAVVIGGKWYLVGGLDNGTDQKLQIYDFGSRTWTLGADLPYKAGSASSAVHNGEIYTCGGIINGSTTTNRCARYNPGTNQWIGTPSLNAERNHAAGCAQGDTLVILGGRDGGNVVGPAFASHLRYSMSTRAQLGNRVALPTVRAGMGVCLYERSALWVFGGELGTSDCRNFGSAAITNGQCAISGGVLLPDGATAWKALPPMPQGKHGIFPIVAGGRVYIIGGGIKVANSDSRTVHSASLAALELCAA